MADTVRWAVVGSAGIARRRTIPEGFAGARNATLVGVLDVDREANRTIAKQYGVAAYRSLRGALAADVDAVYIATPAHLHARQVAACAKAGRHVLCEKPLGLTARDARRMAEACRAAGVRLGTGFMMRLSAQHRTAKDMITRGDLGTLVYGRAQLSCWYPPIAGAWRQDPSLGGGGSLVDMGGHCIDLLEMFFGNVARVSCFINNHVHQYRSEDSAVATLFFANGALATVDTFFCIPDNGSKNVLELYGSQGSILAQGTIGQGPAGRMVAFLEGGDRAYDAQQARDAAQGVAIEPRPVNTYRAEIEEFSQAIIEDRPPLIDGELGLRSQKVLAACYESARSGRTVEVA